MSAHATPLLLLLLLGGLLAITEGLIQGTAAVFFAALLLPLAMGLTSMILRGIRALEKLGKQT